MSFSLKQDLSNCKMLEMIINISYSCLNWQIIIHAQPSAIIQTWKFCVMVRKLKLRTSLKGNRLKSLFNCIYSWVIALTCQMTRELVSLLSPYLSYQMVTDTKPMHECVTENWRILKAKRRLTRLAQSLLTRLSHIFLNKVVNLKHIW